MDTNRIKRFATEARNILKAGIAAKITTLGFDKHGNVAEKNKPQLMQGGSLWNEQLQTEGFYYQWMSLYNRIQQKGINEVYEEAAYTWFNRLCAIRILQKNNLCSPVLAYADAARTPVIVDEARQGRLPQMKEELRQRLVELLDDDTKVTEQFAILITAWCHDNPIINQCFGSIADYTELLLPNNILAEGGFVDMLNHTEFITDEDFLSPELIGWLYQFYISERKDEVFAKKGKFEADEIPAATQIFTPNWIVKYMVQNTVGRIYLDNNPYETQLQKKWQYLVGDVSHVATAGKPTSPLCGEKTSSLCGETPHLLHYDELTDLKVADLACGSGHILNECFDLLYDLYIAEGYGRGEAVENIFSHNLTGIDLDTRAKQLSQFSLLLKACQKDAAFADAHLLPHVMDMAHVSPKMDEKTLSEACLEFMGGYEDMAGDMLAEDFELLKEAEDLGSIMKFNDDEDYLAMLRYHYEDWTDGGIDDCPDEIKALVPGVQVILALTEKYHALVMNPPYMGGGKMNSTLSKYVKDNYEEGKADLFSVFMQMGMERLVDGGKMAQINMQSWMFLSSFEKLRTQFLTHYNIDNMLHLGPRTFDELSGEVVQNTAFVLSKHEPAEQGGVYYRLVDGKNCADKEKLFLSHIHGNEDGNRIYYHNVEQKNFEKIPGCPIGYWLGNVAIDCFEKNKLGDMSYSSPGIRTGRDNIFIRDWEEVSYKRIKLDGTSYVSLYENYWFPITRGGERRVWYGNNSSIVLGYNNFERVQKECPDYRLRDKDYYFKKGLTWTMISSSKSSFRVCPNGVLFGNGGPTLYVDNLYEEISAFLNSSVADFYLKLLNPTINCTKSDIEKLPIVFSENNKVKSLVCQNISISKQDWDAHETSWDFQRNELLSLVGDVSHVTTASGDASQALCGETPHLLRFVNKSDYIHITGNKLPHWNQGGCVQFVTFRLADSLPQAKLKEFGELKEQWMAEHPKPWDIAIQEEYKNKVGKAMDKWIDAGYGDCILKDERVRNIVADCIMHFNGERYDIHAFVIMPNHVHVLLSTRGDNLVQDIVGSWKKFSAHEINKLLGRQGSVWERESFDHMVRNGFSYKDKFDYIISNPAALPQDSYTLVGDVSHVAAANNDASQPLCGETPHPLSYSLKNLMEQYKTKWERKFMQLHKNEEELNRQFIDIYGLQDELTPDVPLNGITILQQGEISIE